MDSRLGGRNVGSGRNLSAIGGIQVMAGEVGLRLRSLAEPRDDKVRARVIGQVRDCP